MKKLIERFKQLYSTNEWIKQIADQTAHVLVGSIAVYVLATMWNSIFLGAGLVALAWAAWEWHQWPSARPWDPPLDWFFQAIGVGLGVWWYG